MYLFRMLEYSVGNSNFTATQILREINFGHVEPPKTANWTTLAALNFELLGIFDIFKCEIT